MKKKNIIIITGAIVTVGILVLVGISLLNKNTTADYVPNIPTHEEKGTLKQLDWIELNELDTYQETLRTPLEKIFFVTVNEETGEKFGRPYFNAAGQNIQNNTFVDACKNQLFSQMLNQEDIISALSDAACNTYADLEVDDEYTNAMLALNGYFNLLPDAEPNYANPDSTLSRAEFLALLTRATTPVTELTVDADFEKLVGKSEYNIYAQESVEYGYLNTSDSSINDKTYVGTISRAEAIYTLVSKYYAEELANVDISDTGYTFTDAKDGGDIATAQGFNDKTYSKSYELVWAINNPDEGLPTDLYKALVVAAKHNIIDYGTESNWDNGLTKAEAIELLFRVASDKSITTDDELISGIGAGGKGNPAYFDEEGYFDRGLEEAGLTREEDLQDGYAGFTQVIHTDGTSHLVCNKDGSIYYHGDLLPTGGTYRGTAKDEEIAQQEALDSYNDYLENKKNNN